MRDKICIVTGASSGIGKGTALELAKLGAEVIMMARSQERGEAAKSEIATKSHNSAVEFLPVALAYRLEGTGITVNAVHPGIVRSPLMKEAPLPIRLLTQIVGATPEKAGTEIAYLASSPEITGASGKFFKNGKIIESSAYS